MKELTDFEVKALKLDGKKERLVSVSPGLLLLLREGKKGITKTWMVEYPRGGKKVTESLGFYESPKPGAPLLTLKEAKTRAQFKLDEAARQANPTLRAIEEKLGLVDAEGNAPATFREAAVRWIEGQAGMGRKDGGASSAALLRTHVLPLIGDMPLELLRQKHVDGALRFISFKKNMKRTAGVALGVIRNVIEFAVKKEWMAGDCTVGLELGAYAGRAEEGARWLREDELKLLYHLLEASRMERQWKLGYWLLLSTGNRSDETLKARVRDVDFENDIWTIPPEHQKKTKPDKIPATRFVDLSGFTKGILKELIELNGHTGYLFPKDLSRVRAGEKVHGPAAAGRLTSIANERQRTRSKNRQSDKEPAPHEELGLLDLPEGHWGSHDLRRTFATFASKLQLDAEGKRRYDRDAIEQCLHHETKTTLQRIYIKDEARHGMIECWHTVGDCLERIIEEAKADQGLAAEASRRKVEAEAKRMRSYAERSKTMKAKNEVHAG